MHRRLAGSHGTAASSKLATQQPALPTVNADLHPCPFCDSRDLTIARATDGDLVTIAVVCLECGVTGPKRTGDDPPQHVAFVWNQRFGAAQ